MVWRERLGGFVGSVGGEVSDIGGMYTRVIGVRGLCVGCVFVMHVGEMCFCVCFPSLRPCVHVCVSTRVRVYVPLIPLHAGVCL